MTDLIDNRELKELSENTEVLRARLPETGRIVLDEITERTGMVTAKSKNISSQEAKDSPRSNHSSLIAMAKEAALKMGMVQTPSGGWITPKK
jgi:hypothetical protein